VLMDEPLGALDKQLREQMQLDIRALHKRLGLTIVFVTHDQGEALTMSDRIAVFNHGRIEQVGTPIEIYDQPKSRFVAEFIGETNLVEGTVDSVEGRRANVVLPDGSRLVVAASGTLRPAQSVIVSIRPERIHLGGHANGVETNRFSTRIVDSVYHGDHLRILLDCPACDFVVKTDHKGGGSWSPGATVEASFAPSDCWVVCP
jgi:putative spermidine/putrescine transport system ATP-binding protein